MVGKNEQRFEKILDTLTQYMVYYDKENKNRPLNGVGAPRGGNANALSKKEQRL